VAVMVMAVFVAANTTRHSASIAFFNCLLQVFLLVWVQVGTVLRWLLLVTGVESRINAGGIIQDL
jgi:hypothetical protein